jgi:transposase
MDLTDKQWEVLAELLPKPRLKGEGKGRPTQDFRSIVNGICWICRTGAAWADLPRRYPPYQTCHRYFQQWCKAGIWDKILYRLAKDLKERGKIDITECFIDGTFASAKKGALVLAKLNGEKAPRSWRSQTLLVFLCPYGSEAPASMK